MATAPGTRMFADGDWCDAASGATVEPRARVDTLTELQTVLVKA